jgi:hypothetical protein
MGEISRIEVVDVHRVTPTTTETVRTTFSIWSLLIDIRWSTVSVVTRAPSPILESVVWIVPTFITARILVETINLRSISEVSLRIVFETADVLPFLNRHLSTGFWAHWAHVITVVNTLTILGLFHAEVI